MTDPTLAQNVLAPRDMLVLGLVLIAVILMMTSVRRRLQNRGRSRTDEAGPATRLPAGEVMKRDMETLMVQLEELSRRIAAQIDTRFQKLETSIADADERIASLEVLLRAARQLPKLDVTVGDAGCAPPGRDEKAGNGGPDYSPIPNDPDKARIYELADSGQSPVQIAQATGRHTGEVELILALRQGRASP